MEQRMKYPIGIQTFEGIITEGFAYVDKTEYIHKLADKGKFYFLSRPRRFGKSLLLSTMCAYFEGRKELFNGLAIDKMETEWTEYPVLYLDFNNGEYQTVEDLKERISAFLQEWEAIYGKSPAKSLSIRFENIIKAAYKKTGKEVVILVDEYDKPLLNNIGNEELQEDFRKILRPFYSNLKQNDNPIRFAFITGVTRFSKVSIFFDLNNLEDISLFEQYNAICGMTELELLDNFNEGIEQLSRKLSCSFEETCNKLRENYDGYHFTPNSEGIYNPFSILHSLKNSVIDDFWFQTGTPKFLVELLKDNDYDLRMLQEGDVDGSILNSIDSITYDPIPVIYQSGYLTIKDYDAEFNSYRLGFPNKEVEQAFMKYLLPEYTPRKNSRSYAFIGNFVRDLRQGNVEQFMKRFQTFFADADYRVAGKMELYFQNAMFILFRLMGCYTQVEYTTSDGRADIVALTPDFIYVIELKLDGSAQEALQQIETNGYAKPFAMDGRKLYKIGVNFSSETRGVEDWKVE